MRALQNAGRLPLAQHLVPLLPTQQAAAATAAAQQAQQAQPPQQQNAVLVAATTAPVVAGTPQQQGVGTGGPGGGTGVIGGAAISAAVRAITGCSVGGALQEPQRVVRGNLMLPSKPLKPPSLPYPQTQPDSTICFYAVAVGN